MAEDAPNGLGMVIDIEPVAYVGPAAIDGQGLSFQGMADHEGDELLPVLAGAVVIAAVGDRGRNPIGAGKGADEMVRGGF